MAGSLFCKLWSGLCAVESKVGRGRSWGLCTFRTLLNFTIKSVLAILEIHVCLLFSKEMGWCWVWGWLYRQGWKSHTAGSLWCGVAFDKVHPIPAWCTFPCRCSDFPRHQWRGRILSCLKEDSRGPLCACHVTLLKLYLHHAIPKVSTKETQLLRKKECDVIEGLARTRHS